MDIIFANDELINLCREKEKIIFWGNGFLGKTVSKEIMNTITSSDYAFWDVKPDNIKSYLPYTINDEDAGKCILVIVCIGNRIIAEQKKKECIQRGYSTILAIDYGYADSIEKISAIEFSLNMGCSLNCQYCPQDVLLRSYKDKIGNKTNRHLSFDDFKKILSYEMNPCSTISFSGMSEPFENSECADMLCYASEHGFRIHINTTLMGMTRKDFEKIKDVNIEKIFLHVPDEERKSHFNVSEEYCNLLQEFIEHFKASIKGFSVHSANVDKRVRHIVEKSGITICDASYFRDRAGNLEILNKYIRKEGRLFCTMMASSYCANVVLPSGELALCCDDYSIEGVGGNIVEQSWKKVISSYNYGKLRIGLDNEKWICKKCSAAKDITHTMEKYPDFAYEKMNCSYVYNIVRNYKDIINLKYRKFFENPIYLYELSENKFSCYFFDNCWDNIFNVRAFVGDENCLGLDFVKEIPYTKIESCTDKSIFILVLSENTNDINVLKKRGFSNVALFKDVVLSYL